MFREAVKRSLAKTISWKVINIVGDFILVYLLSGKFSLAAGFAAISFVVTLILYFFHERIWNKIAWGKT